MPQDRAAATPSQDQAKLPANATGQSRRGSVPGSGEVTLVYATGQSLRGSGGPDVTVPVAGVLECDLEGGVVVVWFHAGRWAPFSRIAIGRKQRHGV